MFLLVLPTWLASICPPWLKYELQRAETLLTAECSELKAVPGTHQAFHMYLLLGSPVVTHLLHKKGQKLLTIFSILLEFFFLPIAN